MAAAIPRSRTTRPAGRRSRVKEPHPRRNHGPSPAFPRRRPVGRRRPRGVRLGRGWS
ncbi:hypothetical protein [Ornithinimicrobium kibberense]|uniref:hypothetical protein n=1 Tax=Ornithinimicrobium kibberense TaxID=282060 RepID=UPI00360DDDA5